MADNDIPCFISNSSADGHSTIAALDGARRLGAWWAEHPDVTLWAMTLALAGTGGVRKVIVRDTSGRVVLYTEAQPADITLIFDAIGVHHDATRSVSTLVADGLSPVDAGTAAALLGC